jgi:lipoate-protein ligase A
VKIWNFENTFENEGKFNMARDIELSRIVNTTGRATLRLYRWKPFTISLGYNQKEDILDLDKCNRDGIGVVKRPTGGRAILHAEELTYSVTMRMIEKNPTQIYNEIGAALVYGLKLYDKRMQEVEFEKNQINFAELYKSYSSIPCFSSSAKYEIKHHNKKLVGSAQRMIGNTILQHGSILCGEFHKNLVDYLRLPNDKLSEIKTDLDLKTISIAEIIENEVDYPKLAACIKFGFQKKFSIAYSNEIEMIEV